mgnify:CR=1 FL=1
MIYIKGFYRNLMNELGAEIIEFDSIFISKLVFPFKFSPPNHGPSLEIIHKPLNKFYFVFFRI